MGLRKIRGDALPETLSRTRGKACPSQIHLSLFAITARAPNDAPHPDQGIPGLCFFKAITVIITKKPPAGVDLFVVFLDHETIAIARQIVIVDLDLLDQVLGDPFAQQLRHALDAMLAANVLEGHIDITDLA